ncbi:MAG TPA: sugar-binding transcriptional regulator [Chloroflexi bacterium]|nr:sugar-binding transcriptional regulator [Chloroflexota bacterium]
MEKRADLLTRVASLYYEENLTQAEIAKRIGTSRSTVSRLLQEAREAGWVEIIIHHRWKTVPAVEQELVARFGLRGARVLAGEDRQHDELLRGLGMLAAEYLDGLIQNGHILGISWGTAIYNTVQALRPRRKVSVTVVQMIGAVGRGDPLIDGPDLARSLAHVYGGEYRCLHAPLVVEDARIKEALLQEPHIRETLALARQADVALVGVGSPVAEVASLLRAGYVDIKTLAALQEQGVVGDVCARHYDIHGKVLDLDINRRIIGIELEDLHRVKVVIGVAGGEGKAEAIVGALRGYHINTLVTDEATALRVLELDPLERGT